MSTIGTPDGLTPATSQQATILPCPECAAGKHRNCDGTTWDRATDALTTCPCFAAAIEAGEDHPGRFERTT